MIEAMSADQRADLFRDLPESDRPRLLKALDEETRDALKDLLRYAHDSAGGIMTTEFVSVPADWTVEQTLRYIREVGRAKETVYAIYITDPATGALQHVVSLRELMVAEHTLPRTDALAWTTAGEYGVWPADRHPGGPACARAHERSR